VKTRFRDLSIRSKLTVMQLVASGVAVLLLFALVLGYQVFLLRGEIVRKVASLSQVVGENSAAALTFGDPKIVRTRPCRRWASRPNVLATRILDRKGQIFALFERAGLDSFATAVPDPGSLSTLAPYREDGAPPVPIRYAFSSGQLRVYTANPARSGDHRPGKRPFTAWAVVPAAALGYWSCGDRLDGFAAACVPAVAPRSPRHQRSPC